MSFERAARYRCSVLARLSQCRCVYRARRIDPAYAFFDRRLAGGVREADVLAIGLNARPEVRVGQHRNAGIVQQPPAQFFRVFRTDDAACFGDIGPRIERASRRRTRNPGS